MARWGGGRRPPVLSLALLALLAGTWLPATAQEPAGAERAEAVYRRPLGNEPATLDPARIGDIYSRAVSQQIFDGLVEFDQTLTVRPALAEFWRASRDGLVWTFMLRKGVKFHHGRELTADDVVFSLTRLLDPATRSGAGGLLANVRGAAAFREGRARHVAGLTAVGPHTVRVDLDEAQVPLVSVLAIGHAKIVPRDLVEREGEGFGAHPVGTGPFRFVRWERGTEIVLAANPEHFDGPPRLARIVYRIFPGEQFGAMYDEFLKGNLEDTPISMRDYHRLAEAGDRIHVKRPMFSVRFYGLNTRRKPLDDRRVRQALVLAIDREAIVRDVTRGRFVPARGVLPPGTLGFNPGLAGYPYDPERARRLLAEAGYPGGRGLPGIEIWANVRLDKEHRRVLSDLEAVGVRAEFRYETDWLAFSTKLAGGELPAFQYAWFADVPDPDNFLFQLFHSRSPRNFMRYANPLVDDLLQEARHVADGGRRVQLYRRAEQLVMDDAPIIPFFHYTYERLFQPYVRSVEVNGLGDPYIPFRKIWLERAPGKGR